MKDGGCGLPEVYDDCVGLMVTRTLLLMLGLSVVGGGVVG